MEVTAGSQLVRFMMVLAQGQVKRERDRSDGDMAATATWARCSRLA